MIVWYLVLAFLSHIIPYKLAIFTARRLADLMYFTFYRRRRGFVFENFRTIKNRDLSSQELHRFAIETYENFCVFIYEFFIIPSVYKKGILNFLTPVNLERMKRPSLVLTAHLGNWEWGASMLAALGFNPMIIALKHQKENVTSFFTRRRNIAGMEVSYLGGEVKKMLDVLKNGDVVATLGDRDYTGKYIIAEFMGREIHIPKGIFEIACKLEVPLIPAFCVKEKGHYMVYFEEAITCSSVKDAVEKWVQILEEYVVRYPTQWYIFDCIWER